MSISLFAIKANLHHLPPTQGIRKQEKSRGGRCPWLPFQMMVWAGYALAPSQPPAGVAVRKRCSCVLTVKPLCLAGCSARHPCWCPQFPQSLETVTKESSSQSSPSSTSAPAPNGNRLLPERVSITQKQGSRMPLGV